MSSTSQAFRCLLLAVSSVTLTAMACGDDAEDAPSSAREFIAEYFALFCDQIGSCCRDNGFVFTEATCEADEVAPEVLAQIDYDREGGNRCLRATREALTACTPLERVEQRACGRVMSGPKLPGDTCEWDFECARPEDPDAEVRCIGYCQEVRTGDEGERCDPSAFVTSICGDGLFCSGADCLAQVSEGGECDPLNDGCAKGLICEVKPGDELSFVCMSRGLGEPCSIDGVCGGGFACAFDTCLCRATAGEEDPCDYDQQCGSGVCNKGKCAAPSIANPDACGDVLRPSVPSDAPACPDTCQSNADCFAHEVCDSQTSQCLACSADNCDGSCHPVSGCVECVLDADCDPKEMCVDTSHTCHQRCSQDTDCEQARCALDHCTAPIGTPCPNEDASACAGLDCTNINADLQTTDPYCTASCFTETDCPEGHFCIDYLCLVTAT
jgi:hypothetical protein